MSPQNRRFSVIRIQYNFSTGVFNESEISSQVSDETDIAYFLSERYFCLAVSPKVTDNPRLHRDTETIEPVIYYFVCVCVGKETMNYTREDVLW